MKIAAVVLLAAVLFAQTSVARARRLRMLATAYCQHGRTATGTQVRWGTVAVDPRVIRLGSRLWVSGYGLGRAEDTGGMVRGYRIDVWMPSCWAARRWGVRWVIVRV